MTTAMMKKIPPKPKVNPELVGKPPSQEQMDQLKLMAASARKDVGLAERTLKRATKALSKL